MKPVGAPMTRKDTTKGRTVDLHPGWVALIRLCRDIDHGEIEGIRIQDGLPVLVEVTRQKIKLI